MISRRQVIQSFLDLYAAPCYLEIGVNKGATFLAIKAERKVAVDPVFRFDYEDEDRKDSSAQFFQVTSDAYFGSLVDRDERFDVIFLDGLHESGQTLRDLINATRFLAEDGVIVIDDVIPVTYQASLPDHRKSIQLREALGVVDKSWMGDIYRVAAFVASYFQQFQFALIEQNHGQLVMWRQSRSADEVVHRSIEEIGRLPFEAAHLERSILNPQPIGAVLATLRERLAVSRP